jgi:N-6 DNA Methylase/Eco57I restriction-modification methylase
MIAGLSGSLLSHDAVSGGNGTDAPEDARSGAARHRLRAWHAAVVREMGPASSARSVYDRVAAPLMSELGFRLMLTGTERGEMLRAMLHAAGTPAAALLVVGWGREPGGVWREGVRLGIGGSVRWCICINGRACRVLDARRTYSRRFIEFDLGATMHDRTTFALFWHLLNAAAFSRSTTSLDEAVRRSEAHRSDVRVSLQRGVHDALERLVAAFARARGRRTAPPAGVLFDESLIVVYRVLFLLFAEARGLVPNWHPTYHNSYTIESLRAAIEVQPHPVGLWETLQAISRLAHRGCRAGILTVPPFNGRLFSPAHAPLAESAALDDGAVREVLLALTTRRDRSGRQRISYADLGVEQLGGVYERILDFEPAWMDGRRAGLTLVPTGRRKAAGAFYTPRALTEYLVRRTLAPLVRDAPPDRILSLRVLDPAMGSGAFLVAACRYLARAYEAALIRDGVVASADLSEPERAGFRRAVAQRCLFGVDINPMAVQLGRLSLWLATLSADRPLTFLDHHLRTGNSLSGASLADVARQPPSTRGSRIRAAPLPLFEADAAGEALGAAISTRTSIATGPGDTLEQVRSKERLMASLMADAAPLGRWKRAADLWCAGWFQESPTAGARERRIIFGAMLDEVLGRGAVLPRHVSSPLLHQAHAAAERERFFHWTLEFPEVFYDTDGQSLPAPGFDAVIGNPPWEMLRGHRAGDEGVGLTEFTRGSGIYMLQGDGHANLFQLFLERALTLVRTGGRIGVVLPSGFASDHGCAALRRHLMDRTLVDTFVSIENREGLFPIHRALKFLLITASAGGSTAALSCRFGVRSPDELDQLPDVGEDPGAVSINRALMAQLSGEQHAVPELRTMDDVSLASKIAFSVPALSHPAGWNVAFGRELNATDDRRHFIEAGHSGTGRAGGARPGSYPIVEGKQIQPFTVDVAAARFSVPPRIARTLLNADRTYAHPRLAYRDVASSTNRLTLIAAIIPADVLTTHTLFCLKGNVEAALQQFLCAVFNSFVANYLVRLRVGMHVTVSIIERLPVPVIAPDLPAFRALAALSARLSKQPQDENAAASLQARVARLYGLDRTEFQHVLGTFPLIPIAERSAALTAFCAETPCRET